MSVDTFLVGDGSQKLLEKGSPDVSEVDYTDQLAVSDSFDPIDRVDDISLMSGVLEKIEVSSFEDLVWVYQKYKAEAYKYFDFVLVKSLQYSGVPLREEDLVITERDKSLINYLKDRVSDLYIWKNIAYLQAFLEMRITYVVFKPLHACPLCAASKDVWYRVDTLLGRLCEGSALVHDTCDSELFPVVQRELYEGPLLGYLDTEVVALGPVDLVNVPRELLRCTDFRNLLLDFPCLEIEFVDFVEWAAKGVKDLVEGAVACVEGETLYIHNSYVGHLGPVDYIKAFLSDREELPERLSTSQALDAVRYILGGREVLQFGSAYYHAKTKERLDDV